MRIRLTCRTIELCMHRFVTVTGNEELPILYIHRQSAYLLGRDRKVRSSYSIFVLVDGIMLFVIYHTGTRYDVRMLQCLGSGSVQDPYSMALGSGSNSCWIRIRIRITEYGSRSRSKQ